MKIAWQRRRLELRHDWTLSRGTATHKEYVFVTVEQDGIVGYGEAAHNERYGESLEAVETEIEIAASKYADRSPEEARPQGKGAAVAAIEMAQLDWSARKENERLCDFLGLEAQPVTTSFSIGIEQNQESLAKRIHEADAYPILKIKLGTPHDREVIDTICSITDKPLRIDANEGWTDRERALAMMEWLAEKNVELIEQPLPANRLDDTAWLRERSPLPLIADEDAWGDCNLEPFYDGLNVKVMKVGGIRSAVDTMESARARGMKVMLGCMIESSLGITAACHLASLADYVDLDGNLLVANDPFEGARCENGILTLPDRPGIGAVPID